jgi:replicative DNA helicase
MSHETLFERPLPSSPETERAILGAIILDNRLIDEAVSLVRIEDFYVPSHRRIFIAMLALHERHIEINPILIAEELRRDQALEGVGGVSFLTNLTYGLPHVSGIKNYARVVRGKADLRWTIKECAKITNQALEEEDEPQVILASAAERFSAMREKNTNGFTGGQLADVGRQVEDHLYVVQAGVNPTIPTGIERLDALTGGGISPGQMWGIGALSSRGKTAFLLQMLMHMAGRRELGVTPGIVLFSLEMTSLLLGLRVLAGAASFPINHIKVGMPQGEVDLLLKKAKEAFDLPMWVYTDCRSVSDIHARIKMLKRKHPIQVVGVDYYGLLRGRNDNNRYENRTQELKYIASYLQQEIAISEEVGLIVPAQFNRSGWGAAELGPGNIDGGEAFHQACDMFAVLNTEKSKKVGAVTAPASFAIHKQRNGPTATGKDAILLDFNKDRMMFFPRLEDSGEEVPDEPTENMKDYL